MFLSNPRQLTFLPSWAWFWPHFLDKLSLTRVPALQLPADVRCSKTTLLKPVNMV